MISANFRIIDYSLDWLDASACNAIIEKFGRIDGAKVIDATNTYLAGLDSTKASALASYLNEDPMMVCSLGLEPQGVTMPIRWLCNAREGDYAYCLTDEIINTATDTLKYRVRTYSRSSNWQVMTPYYKENTLTLQKYGDPYALSVSYGAGTWANVKQGVNTEQGLIVEFRAGTGPYINGSFIPNRYGAFTTPGTYVLGGNNYNNTTKTGGPIDLGDVFEHYRNGVLIHQFAPIVCNTKNGMIDLVNMEFHPNQGTGHFTDAYTLQDGVTPWTPIHDTDSQYLTAAGFGKYRITAASLGNLDLLGTWRWLKQATQRAILGAFGDDGWAVINATNAYLNGIAASDRDKATALAGFINQHPLDAALYGGLYVQDGLVFQMDRAYECTAAKWTDFIGGVEFNGTNVQIVDDVPYFNGSASMSSSSSVLYNSGTSTIEAVFKREKTAVCVILSGGAANDGNLQLLLARQGTYHFRNVTNYSAFVDSASTNLLSVSLNADRGFQNKVALSRQQNTGADTSVQSYSMIGNRAAGSSLPYQGYLYSIRIYNRILTEAETLANQDIDLKRFTPSTP